MVEHLKSLIKLMPKKRFMRLTPGRQYGSWQNARLTKLPSTIFALGRLSGCQTVLPTCSFNEGKEDIRGGYGS